MALRLVAAVITICLSFASVSVVKAQWMSSFGPEGVTDIAVNGSHIFAVSGAIYLSADNGKNWTLGNAPMQFYSIMTNGDDVIAGTDKGVYVSSDDGRNWTAQNKGLTNTNIRSVARNDNYLFAIASNYSADGAVFRSGDNGLSWTKLSNGLSASTNYSMLAVSGSYVFVKSASGLYRSSNNGNSWTAVTGLENEVTSLAISGGTIFAGTGPTTFVSKILVSKDYGSTWTILNDPLEGKIVTALLIKGEKVFAGTHEGIYVSSNSGLSWKKLSNGLPTVNFEQNRIHTLYTNNNTIYAGMKGNSIITSTDDGAHWTSLNDDEAFQVWSLATTGNDVFAGASNGVYLSSDAGEKWSARSSGLPIATSNFYSLAINGNRIYAGGQYDGIYLSTNKGSSWSSLSPGWSTFYNRVVVKGNRVFTGTSNEGVFVSTDNGSSWTRVNNGLPGTEVISIAASDSYVFAGIGTNGVFRSPDNGASWTAVNDGLTSTYVTSLATHGNTVFAGTGNGIFRSNDNGSNWIKLNTSPKDVSSITISGDKIFVTSFEEIVFSVDQGDTWIAANEGWKRDGEDFSNNRVNCIAVGGDRVYAGAWRMLSRPLSDFDNIPVITSFTPASGLPGTAVTIKGSNFNATPGNNVVKFNGTLATITEGTANSLSVKVPAGATTGPISVFNGSLTVKSKNNFTITTLPPVSAPDSLALVVLYNATGGANWTAKNNWLSGRVSTWYGVTVTDNRVTGLNLNNNQLFGSIPPSVGNLAALTSLYLSENNLSGAIPSTLISLTSLKALALSYNQLTGSIPTTIGVLTKLEILALQSNQLTGTLPSSVGTLTNLVGLSLRNNQLSGAIPPEIGMLDKLSILLIDNNQFTALPVMTGLSAITELNVSNNQFTFEDLEPNKILKGIVYTPQKNIPAANYVTLNAGEALNLSYAIGGSANQYEWTKDGNHIGTNASVYRVTSVTDADAGDYQLQITNTLVPGLTISTDPLTVTVKDHTVTGLEQSAENGIALYPNPAEDELFILGLNEMTGSKLSDAKGKEYALEFVRDGNRHYADVRQLSPGLYLLHIPVGHAFAHIKFLKK